MEVAIEAGAARPAERGLGEGRENEERLGGRAGGVEEVEERVAEEDEEAGLAPEEGEGVEGVADDFGEGPGEHHGCVERARVRLERV